MKPIKSIRSKGQGAMEYLMNYSWAILVVVTVGLVLWQMGVFNSPTSSITMTGWGQIQPLAAGIVYKADGNYQAVFNNVAGIPIQITNATVTDISTGLPCSDPATNPVYIHNTAMPGNVTVASGKEFVLNIACNPKQADTPYNTQITIEYNAITAEDTTTHIETGQIQGTVEE